MPEVAIGCLARKSRSNEPLAFKKSRNLLAMRRIPPERSLFSRFPAVAAEWNWERNGSLTPKEITAFNDRKVWWRCDSGHEWNARIANRARGSGCPYCAGKRASPERNLASEFPELATEWHPTKNGTATPELATPFSGAKRWWKCSHGHEWKATIASRSSGRSCPYCWKHSSRPELRVLAELETIFDSVLRRRRIAGTEVDLLIQKYSIGIEYDGSYWHRDLEERDRKKNKTLSQVGIRLLRVREEPLPMLSDLDIGCGKRAFLKRDMDELFRRISQFCDTPDLKKIDAYIAKRRFQNPEVYKQYVSTIRNPIPEDSLETRHPNVAEEWDYTKNAPLLPEHFSRGSQEKVWWRCPKGHSWQTPILTRTINGSGCPYCAGNLATEKTNLMTKVPRIASEWDYEKNSPIQPDEVTPYSNRNVWWKCSRGHSWQSRIASRVRSYAKCPYCSGRIASNLRSFATEHPELADQWHPTKNGELRPTEVTPASGRMAWWQCGQGHEWKASVNARHKGRGCPYCSGRKVSRENNLAIRFPTIATEWDIEKNDPLRPNQFTYGSKRKVWWKCCNGHSWIASINSRTNKAHMRGCPSCARIGQKKEK